VQIQRSNDDLQVTCNKPGLETGRASVVSIMRPGMVGNFFFGGIIGVAIDHASGAAYDYPNMIQVMMGQMTQVGYSEGHATAHTNAAPESAQTDLQDFHLRRKLEKGSNTIVIHLNKMILFMIVVVVDQNIKNHTAK
jgi:hypothetical protein